MNLEENKQTSLISSKCVSMQVFVGWTDEATEEISIFMDMIPAIATYSKSLPKLRQFINKNKHTYKYLSVYLLVSQSICL